MATLPQLIEEDVQQLESVLQEYFGEVPLSQAVTETLVTSYELQTREPWFFAPQHSR